MGLFTNRPTIYLQSSEEYSIQKNRCSVIDERTHSRSPERSTRSGSSQSVTPSIPRIQFFGPESQYTLGSRSTIFKKKKTSTSSELLTGQCHTLEFSNSFHLEPLLRVSNQISPSLWEKQKSIERGTPKIQSLEDESSESKLFSDADNIVESIQISQSPKSIQSSYSALLERSNVEHNNLLTTKELGVQKSFSKEIDIISASPFILMDHKDTLSYLLKSNKNFPHALFSLSIDLRWKIYYWCFPSVTKKISLSHGFETKKYYPEDFFQTPWSILEPVMGAISSFQALRLDLMTYFWTEYEFHVTLSPFTGPAFSLSQVWLVNYFHVIQKLTIEVNTTNFSNVLRMEKLDRMFRQMISSLLNRSYQVPIRELHLICRRYIEDANSCHEFPYLSEIEDNWSIFENILNLRGILQQVRITGLPREQTVRLLKAIFEAGTFTLPKKSPWPTNRPITLTSQLRDPLLDLQGLNRSQSFSRDFEFDSNGSWTNPSVILRKNESKSSKASPKTYSSLGKFCNLQRVTLDESYPTSLNDKAVKNRFYSTCLSPLNFKDINNSTSKNYGLEESQRIGINSSRWNKPVFTEETRTDLELCQAKIESRFSSSLDLDRINDANERDPAFIRTVSAIKNNTDGRSTRPEYRRQKLSSNKDTAHTINKPSTLSTRECLENKNKVPSFISLFGKSHKKAF